MTKALTDGVVQRDFIDEMREVAKALGESIIRTRNVAYFRVIRKTPWARRAEIGSAALAG